MKQAAALFLITLFAGMSVARPSSIEIEVPRLPAATINVDGVLDEPHWNEAAVLTGFTQYLPVDGRTPVDSTAILVWYSSTAIHFGVRAFEEHGPVQATLADRDRLGGDDHIMFLLDTYNDRREAIMISVNPFGQQSDGIVRDSRSAGSFVGVSSSYSVDVNPDFVYSSRGRLTDFGYEIEVVLPFKSLRYQAADVQDWGFQVARTIQHAGATVMWTSVKQGSASFLSQMGVLRGLHSLSRGRVLEFNPELTGSLNRGAGEEADWRGESPFHWGQFKDDGPGGLDNVGLNVKWGITENLTMNGTLNPDFSQVEADVAQLQYDPRAALFYPEKRPFFLEGSEVFSTPTNLIYTRRIGNPVSAAKLTGKAGRNSVGVISAIDNGNPYLSNIDAQIFNALRVRRDLSGQNTIGLVYTDKVDGDHWNRVAAVDGRLVSGVYGLTYQLGGSLTGDPGRTIAAPMWQTQATATGRHLGATFTTYGYHDDFNTEIGFIQRVGIAGARFVPRYTVFGQEGAVIESFTGGLTFEGQWDYDRFTRGTGPNDRKLHFNTSARLRGGWSSGLSIFYESFKKPTGLYDTYAVQRFESGVAVDTVAFMPHDRLINLGGWYSLGTPRIRGFSAGMFLIYGRDDNFDEWASADIYFATVTLRWNPTEQLRAELLYNHQQYVRSNDKTTVRNRRVPRLKVEYQVTPSLFLRVVGQYDARFRDALRDNSRSEHPILILDRASGEYQSTSRVRSNLFSVDWLLSYRPTPGTVLFLGYGRSQTEPDTYRFRDFTRLSDGFFMKLSYRYRT